MSNKETSLDNFFEKRERLNDKIAEDSKITNKKKAVFKRKYRVLLALQQMDHILQIHFV